LRDHITILGCEQTLRGGDGKLDVSCAVIGSSNRTIAKKEARKFEVTHWEYWTQLKSTNC
jgi:hypothetical protein